MLLSLALFGCGPALAPAETDTDVEGPSGDLLGIGIAPRDPIAREGDTVEFFATAYFDNTDYQDVSSAVTWAVSDTSVASIDPSGKATALREGETSVIATHTDGTSNSVRFTVLANEVALSSVRLAPSAASLNVGETRQFAAQGTYSDGSVGGLGSGCTWSTSDSAVASINDSALVSAVAEGSATITAACDGFSPTAEVTVVAEEVDLGEPNLHTTSTNVFAVGTTVTWQVDVVNDGDGVSGGFWIDAVLDSVQAPTGDAWDDTTFVPELGPHETESVTLELVDAPPGDHTSWIRVDPEDLVAESDESDNTAGPFAVSPAVPLLGPDLQIIDFDWVVVEDVILYHIEVENHGDVAATGFYVDVFRELQQAPDECVDGDDYVYVSSLDPGHIFSWDPEITPVPGPTDIWTSWVFADSCAAVHESDEQNNMSHTLVY